METCEVEISLQLKPYGLHGQTVDRYGHGYAGLSQPIEFLEEPLFVHPATNWRTLPGRRSPGEERGDG